MVIESDRERSQRIILEIPALDEWLPILAKLERENGAKLDRILSLLEPRPPARLIVTTTALTDKENEMPVKTHKFSGVDLRILEDGKGVSYKLAVVDANGTPTTFPAGTPPLVAASSDPALTLAVDPSDTSGFNLAWIGTPGNTPAVGVVATFSTTPAGASQPLSGAADPIDIVAAPPGSPAAFVITESAL